MTETPKCPYCGAEMMMEKYYNKEIYWYICVKCDCAAPMGKNPEEALSAALHRAELKKDEKGKAE